MRTPCYDENMNLSVQGFSVAIFTLLCLISPLQTSLQSAYWPILISFIVNLIVLTFVLFVGGLVVVGRQRAKLSSAFAIALIGAFVNFVLGVFFIVLPVVLVWEYLLVFRVLLSLIVWLSLIKNFYRTGWLGALMVAILTAIIMVVLELLLKSLLVA